MTTKRVFAREASGLVREMSMMDIFFYGVLASSLNYFVYFFPMTQYYWPGSSLSIGFLIAFLPAIPFLVSYAAAGSAMPRAGGDYVFQSRLLHPAIGFAVPMAWFVLFWWAVVALGGYAVATLGLGPLMYLMGYSWGNPTYVAMADWITGQWGIFIISEIVSFLAFLTIVAGMKWYVRVQRWILVPTVVITTVVIILLFGTASHTDFVRAFNLLGEHVSGDANLYGSILNIGQANAAIPTFSLPMTLLFMMTPLVAFSYAMYSAQGLLGEIKRAENFKLLVFSFVGAALFLLVVNFGIPALAFENTVGWDFIYSFAYAFYAGEVYFPAPSIGMFAALLSQSPIVWILTLIGFVTIGYYYSTCVYLNNTRVLLAMGLDRTLPEWFSKVNERFHTPINAAIFYFIGSTVWVYLFVFWEPFFLVTTIALVITALGGAAITCLGVALMPRLRPDIWKVAPARKYGALVPIVGLIAFLIGIVYFYAYLTQPLLGGTDPVAQAAVVGLLLACLVFYYVYRAYQKTKGIDVDLATREIPPD